MLALVLAFAPLAVDDPTEALDALAIGAELYAHPAPALANAQALAAGTALGSLDGAVVAALIVVYRDDEMWAAGCGRCFRPVGDVHASACVQSGAVMPHESVVRPAEQMTRSRPAA